MIFTRVIPAGTSPCRHCGWTCQHRHVTHHQGHTQASRHQLAAWDAAVRAWQLWQYASPYNANGVEAFHLYVSTERSWEFLSGIPGGPNDTAHLA